MTDPTLEKLLTLRKKLEDRIQRLGEQMEEAERQLGAVSTTLALIQGTAAPTQGAVPGQIDPRELRGKTQPEALFIIAKRNNNIVKASEARKLMISAGIMKPTKNTSNIFYNVINRTGRFVRIAPGTYRLTDAAPEAEQQMLPEGQVQ